MRLIEASLGDSGVTSAVTTACNRLAAQASALALTKPLTTLALTSGYRLDTGLWIPSTLMRHQAQRPTVSAPVTNALSVLRHEVGRAWTSIDS